MRRRNVAFGRLQLRPECLCARGPVCAAVWLSRGVLRSWHARCAALSRRFVFVARPLCGSLAAFCVRVTPAVCRMSAKQDGLRYVSFLFRRGSGSPVVRSRVDVRLSDLAGSLRVCAFSGGDPDGERGTESAARQSAFLRKRIGFVVLSAGSPLGAECGSRTAAAPKPAPKSRMWKRHCRLSGLSSFDSRCGRVLRGGHSARAQRRQLALPTASTPPPFSIFSTRWHSAASR